MHSILGFFWGGGQSKFIIYSAAFSLQYSVCALYLMMILSQYSSKPTVALSVNFYILQSSFVLQGSATQYTLNVMRCKEENDGEARSNRLNCGLLKCQNDCDIPNCEQKSRYESCVVCCASSCFVCFDMRLHGS